MLSAVLRPFVVLSIAALALLPAAAQAQESAANRATKTGYVALEAIGLTLMPGSGLRGGYFITPNIAAEAGFAVGSAKVGDFEASKTVIETKAKWFFANSFYVDGGLTYEAWKAKYPVLASSTGFATETLDGSVNNIGASVHIGNQWQWTGFTLGCDWLGYFASLSTSASFKSDGGVNASDKKSQEDAVKVAMGGNSVHALRLYGGWAF